MHKCTCLQQTVSECAQEDLCMKEDGCVLLASCCQAMNTAQSHVAVYVLLRRAREHIKGLLRVMHLSSN
jgi:hypothetical protein